MSPFYDDPSLAGDRPPYEGLFDAQLRLPLQPRPAVETIVKRDGRLEIYDTGRVAEAIRLAAESVSASTESAESFARAVTLYLSKRQRNRAVTVEQVHEAIERVLMEMDAHSVAAAYAHRYRRAVRKGDPGRAYSIETLFDDIEKTTRNGGEAWDPSAANRALLRCVQSHYAAARVFSWDIMEAHRAGDIHVHALHALDIFESVTFSDGEAVAELSPDGARDWLRWYCARARNLQERCLQLTADAPIVPILAATDGCPSRVVSMIVDGLLDRIAPTGKAFHTLRIREADQHFGPGTVDLWQFILGRSSSRIAIDVSARSLAADWPHDMIQMALARLANMESIEFRVQADQAMLPYDSLSPHAMVSVAGRVTMNLARAAQKSTSIELLFREFDRVIELVHRAHAQRYRYLLPLLERSRDAAIDNLPHGMLPFVVGVSGLNECVARITGEDLGDSDEATAFAEEILARLHHTCTQRTVSERSPLLLGPTKDLAVRDRFDTLDRARFGSTCRVPSSPGIDFPQDDLDPFEVAHIYARLFPFIDEGHACECALEPGMETHERTLDWVRRVFTETPCESVILRGPSSRHG